MSAIHIAAGEKIYSHWRREIVALRGLDLTVPPGSVFGFLGPNGAGKSTTIRILVGLARPTSGEWSVLSQPISRLEAVSQRVGVMLEKPPFLPGISGRRALELLARRDGVPDRRIREVLAFVGLEARADDLVSAFSYGMRQRLSLASALLSDPELLILDEPLNGLDPAGIHDFREMVRTLHAEGRTVFLSSHMLSEVQALCDQVAILDHGKTIAQGDIDQLTQAGRNEQVVVRCSRVSAAKERLESLGFSVALAEDGSLVIAGRNVQTSMISKTLVDNDIEVYEMRKDAATLEDIYMRLTSGES